MRWIWIDKFEVFETGKRAVAVKCATTSEEHVHDLYPDFAIMPHSLVIEGMAQTAGILVGDANGYREKVILAKIGKADFHRMVRCGETIRLEATADTIHANGASVTGRVTMTSGEPVADITLMFSHIDQNMAGIAFPEHNFVFNPSFLELLDGLRREIDLKL